MKMKTCVGCTYAEWKRTKAGRLHPSGDGMCRYKYKVPQLPQSMYWIGNEPSPAGGYINRREKFKDHCAYYQRAEN